MGEQVGQILSRAFDPRRDEPGGDYRRFEQAEIVLCKIKYLTQLRNSRRGSKVHRYKAQDGLIDDPQPCRDRWPGAVVPPMHAEVDRHIEDARAFGIIHPKKEDIAPGAVGQVHAHRRLLTKDRVGAVRVAAQELRADTERLVERMAHPEHPLVATHAAHAPAHLVRKGLKTEPLVRCRQRAADRVGRPAASLFLQKDLDGLLKSSLKQMLETPEGDQTPLCDLCLRRDLEPVHRVQEKQRPNALVEVGG